MGRRERSLERDGTPLREFAYWVRDLRRAAGLTYSQISRRTSFSVSALQEAAAGRRLPSIQVTLALVDACGGDAEAWRGYWRGIRRLLDEDRPAGLRESVSPPWADEP
jgi:transcriptional regulator with XRE-family HTH domain